MLLEVPSGAGLRDVSGVSELCDTRLSRLAAIVFTVQPIATDQLKPQWAVLVTATTTATATGTRGRRAYLSFTMIAAGVRGAGCLDVGVCVLESVRAAASPS